MDQWLPILISFFQASSDASCNPAPQSDKEPEAEQKEEEVEKEKNGDDKEENQKREEKEEDNEEFRKRLTSIVKPAGEEEEEAINSQEKKTPKQEQDSCSSPKRPKDLICDDGGSEAAKRKLSFDGQSPKNKKSGRRTVMAARAFEPTQRGSSHMLPCLSASHSAAQQPHDVRVIQVA